MHVDHDTAKGNLLAALAEAGFLIGVEKNRYFWKYIHLHYTFEGCGGTFNCFLHYMLVFTTEDCGGMDRILLLDPLTRDVGFKPGYTKKVW